MKVEKSKTWDFTSRAYQIHLVSSSPELFIRIFGKNSLFNINTCELNKLFSFNQNLDKNIITIGSPEDGISDPNLISTILKEEQSELCHVEKIHIYLDAHGKNDPIFKIDLCKREFFHFISRLSMTPCISEKGENVEVTADEFFAQFLPFALKLNKPVDFIVRSCYGGDMHSAELLPKFPEGSRLLSLSTKEKIAPGWYIRESFLPKEIPGDFDKMDLMNKAIFILGVKSYPYAESHKNVVPTIFQVSKIVGGSVKQLVNQEIIEQYFTNHKHFGENRFLRLLDKKESRKSDELEFSIKKLKSLAGKEGFSVEDLYSAKDEKTQKKLKDPIIQSKFLEIKDKIKKNISCEEDIKEFYKFFGLGDVEPKISEFVTEDGLPVEFQVQNAVKILDSEQDRWDASYLASAMVYMGDVKEII